MSAINNTAVRMIQGQPVQTAKPHQSKSPLIKRIAGVVARILVVAALVGAVVLLGYLNVKALSGLMDLTAKIGNPSLLVDALDPGPVYL